MSIRKKFKTLVSYFLIPLTKWYLRKERKYSYKGIRIKVSPTVFHPGLFYSTRFLLSYLEEQKLAESNFIELGCGSGLISIYAAAQGAKVTSSDLNPAAVQCCRRNANENQVEINILHSDLFDSIPAQVFDWVIINPPYYAKPADTDEELAWNCGEHFEYFTKLFGSLKKYIHSKSKVVMVLTLGCDINSIRQIGKENGFEFQMIREKNVLFDERDFLFEILLQPNKVGRR